jgi:cytochrome c oxidase cbb3-type subunit 3
MKFITHHFEKIVGIETFPLISLGIFVAFFVGLLVYVVSMNKKDIEIMESLPLEKETE